MRTWKFLALVVCSSSFALGAHASAPGHHVAPAIPDTPTKAIVTVEGAPPAGLSEKRLIPPKMYPAPRILRSSLERKRSIAGVDELGPMSHAKAGGGTATGPGTSPGTAPHLGVNRYYEGTLPSAGAQHWIYTQADRDGQLTVHLDVPDDTTIDYDLYVYRYELSTGTLYTFKSSTRGPTASEHISFMATVGSYWFIHIQSYQGGSETMPYCLHVEMTAPGEGDDIDDDPAYACTISPLLNDKASVSGELSTPNDEDFFKFTTVGTGSVITFYRDRYRTDIVADLYILSGTTLLHVGTLPEPGRYPLSTARGSTYYLHVHHLNNKVIWPDDHYSLRLNSFNCDASLDRATVVGENVSGSQVLYVVSDRLYNNSDIVMSLNGGLEPLCKYRFEEPNTTFRKAVLDARAVSPVRWVCPVSYTVSGSGSGVSSMSDALAIYIVDDASSLCGVYYENSKISYQDPDTGVTHDQPSLYTQRGYTTNDRDGIHEVAAFILDPSDRKIKDFASYVGNGFYNGYFDRHSFVITWK